MIHMVWPTNSKSACYPPNAAKIRITLLDSSLTSGLPGGARISGHSLKVDNA